MEICDKKDTDILIEIRTYTQLFGAATNTAPLCRLRALGCMWTRVVILWYDDSVTSPVERIRNNKADLIMGNAAHYVTAA